MRLRRVLPVQTIWMDEPVGVALSGSIALDAMAEKKEHAFGQLCWCAQSQTSLPNDGKYSVKMQLF